MFESFKRITNHERRTMDFKMKYSEAKQGRVFIIRLEDGDIIHESIEKFAREKKIRSAALIILGGADDGSKLVVGPKEGRASPVVPMDLILQGAHEVTGTGTIFPNEKGNRFCICI